MRQLWSINRENSRGINCAEEESRKTRICEAIINPLVKSEFYCSNQKDWLNISISLYCPICQVFHSSPRIRTSNCWNLFFFSVSQSFVYCSCLIVPLARRTLTLHSSCLCLSFLHHIPSIKYYICLRHQCSNVFQRDTQFFSRLFFFKFHWKKIIQSLSF